VDPVDPDSDPDREHWFLDEYRTVSLYSSVLSYKILAAISFLSLVRNRQKRCPS
jgi:hypothetical protein